MSKARNQTPCRFASLGHIRETFCPVFIKLNMKIDLKEKDKDGNFTPEAVHNIVQLGVVLHRIYNRLMIEGYRIIDDKLLSPEEIMSYNEDNKSDEKQTKSQE